jgi:hypothetical protein
MTAYVDAETTQRIRDTSPWGCLHKPFTVQVVQALLDQVLDGPMPDGR